MGMIYRSALQTVAHLGLASWGSDMICRCLQANGAILKGSPHLVHTDLGILAAYLFAGLQDTPDFAVDPSFIHILWEQFDQPF